MISSQNNKLYILSYFTNQAGHFQMILSATMLKIG